MKDLVVSIHNQGAIFTMILILDAILAIIIAPRLYLILNRHLVEALGGRGEKKRPYQRYAGYVRKYIERYGSRANKDNFFTRLFRKAKAEVKRCGYYSNLAAFMYIFLRYVLPVIVFILGLLLNYPRVLPAVSGAVLIFLLVNYSMRRMRQKLENEFKYSAYKIYRYLHNQISSGVSVTDAIKTVYKVADDSKLQDNLILLAARYARTLDINSSLEEFKSNYSLQEVESLCVALKQGIETGDNKDILERQEKLMFSQYFNYIQAETDACRRKRTLITAVYALIIIIMLSIPMINDAVDAVGKIFVG
ncbi:hypothetical protein CDQ84_03610 [Clostridium thermosuccinogenes]|uniref:Type II secretion system protein GspF domain-containing protein n=1 Tax=Clostridium thermosuccinogenes TaxID=84032 RepID=A0A2K2FK63_9CLOT|nr:hypothetical protein [Pseudoclostridium thermosuccinogenes]AUS95108.1 hypothetical protein CDO33_00770 [Pseudoclostridium thermosuccinogenes]PNT91471.1 hypothetical protein CDQ83_16940 [Pseudoclostridium thermosuccinogenes]PNT99172.1 hypothetical protein CDQ85_03610 [Pseudoclostridium thermosuccinogenes]PNU00975.1 hypothetical protein CDQ84_03610 [Pseudoclostridium thermosuccinogenes]